MEEFLKPSWWISVVVAGLLVNLASAYIKPRVDGALLRSSAWWRSRSSARLAALEARVALLVRDDRELQSAKLAAFESSFTGFLQSMAATSIFFVGLLTGATRLFTVMPDALDLVEMVCLFLLICSLLLMTVVLRKGDRVAIQAAEERIGGAASAPSSSVPPA